MTYKKTNLSGRKLIFLNEDNDYAFQIDLEVTSNCIFQINEYRHMIENKHTNSHKYLASILNYISQNYLQIDPNIYINTNFLNQIIYYFKCPDLGILSIFDDICNTIELLTCNQIICDSIIQNRNFDLMSDIADMIKNESNVKYSSRYLNIIIHLLQSFFKCGHEETELFLDSISQSGAYLFLIKFVANVLYHSPTISIPEEYISILNDSLERLDKIDEEVLNYVLISLYYLAEKDITNNSYILENSNSIFKFVMKYFDLEDPNISIYFNSKKVMKPLLEYIILCFKSDSIDKTDFEKIIYEYTGIPFFMEIVLQTQDYLIRKKALDCIVRAISLKSLEKLEEVQNFLVNPDLFNLFANILRNETYQERYLAFLIIILKLKYASRKDFELIYSLDIINEVKDFISNETEKVLIFYNLLLLNMKNTKQEKEVALKINDLCIFDEVQKYMISESSSLSDVDKESISHQLENFENTIGSILNS